MSRRCRRYIYRAKGTPKLFIIHYSLLIRKALPCAPVAFIIYTILTGYEVICLILQKEISSVNKIIFAGLYVVYFLFFTIEPSLDWSVHFMTPWLFLHGLIHGYVKNERRGRKCYFL